MPRPILMPDLGLQPPVDTSPGWLRDARSLNGDTSMQRLAHLHWVRAGSPLGPLQRTALLDQVLDRPESQIRVTGLSALQLYGLPIGGPDPVMDALLGHPPPPRAHEYAKMLGIPHFSWTGIRRKALRGGIRVTKSYGLGRFPGPWGCHLADPVEALVVAAPFMPRWRITACCDALMSRRIEQTGGGSFPPYDRALLEKRLNALPPTSRAVLRVKAALRDAAENTWSPTETLTRLIVVAHGLPAPVMNHRAVIDFMDRYLDLAWPEARVAVEYNGADHTDRRVYGDEMFRRQRLEDSGWSVRYIVWEDLMVPARRTLWLGWLAEHLAGHP